MTFQGGDPEAMRLLAREAELARVRLAASRTRIDRALARQCMASSVPGQVRAVERWLDELAAELGRRALELEERPEPPLPLTVTGFPQGYAGDCDLMAEEIGRTVDDLARRLRDLRADPRNLRVLRPRGPFSFDGHIQQAKGRQRRIKKQLETWDRYSHCPDHLTVALAREYVKIDVRAELGWPAAAVASASRSHFWDGVDWRAAGKAVAGVAVVVTAAAASVARAANPVNLLLGP